MWLQSLLKLCIFRQTIVSVAFLWLVDEKGLVENQNAAFTSK